MEFPPDVLFFLCTEPEGMALLFRVVTADWYGLQVVAVFPVVSLVSIQPTTVLILQAQLAHISMLLTAVLLQKHFTPT